MFRNKKHQHSFIGYFNLKNLLALGGAICAVLISIYTLFTPPMPGVADQGDFQRVMSVTGLRYMSNDSTHWFRYVISKYKMLPLDSKRLTGTVPTTSMIYPIEIAREISKLAGNSYFSTKILAAVYAAFYILSFYLCLKSIKFKKVSTSVFFTMLSLIILMDGSYLIWFNSLYGEPMIITSLLFFIASILYVSQHIKRLSITDVFLMFISSYLFLGAKLQCFSALPLVVLLIIRIVLFREKRTYVYRLVNVFMAVSMILVLIFYVKGIYREVNRTCGVDTMYNSVFYGILKESKNPVKDLKTLGLSPSLAVDAGKHAYLPKERYVRYVPWSELTRLELNDKMSNFKLLKFYILNPGRLLEGMEYTASKCFDTIGTLGKFERSSVKEYISTFKRFTYWSDIRSFLPKSMGFIVPFYASVFAVTVREYRRNKASNAIKHRIELLWTIMMIGILQFPMPFIGNGEADTAKQLFLFNYTFDITCLCAASWIFDKVLSFWYL